MYMLLIEVIRKVKIIYIFFGKEKALKVTRIFNLVL